MSIVLQGSTSGSITLQEPAIAGSTVLSLPATSGTLITTGSSGQVIPKAALPTGSVLQVVNTIKTDTFSTNSNDWTSITGLSVTITPTSSTSRILVMYSACVGQSDSGSNRGAGFRITRNGTAVGIANAAGSRTQQGSYAVSPQTNEGGAVASQQYYDNPATTSALTYQLQLFWTYGSTHTVYINRSGRYLDVTEASQGVWTSSITAMEIAA